MIIKRKKRGRGASGWMPEFNKGSMIEAKRRILLIFKRTQKRLMVLEGSEKCIDFQVNPNPELNGLDRATLEELSNLEVIRRSGEVKIKHELPLVFWLLFAMGAINVILTIMNMRGMRLV